MYKFFAELTADGKAFSTKDLNNDAFSLEMTENDGVLVATLKAKEDINMTSLALTCERKFDDNDLFYANGYQSWTTSREFSKKDNTHGYAKISNISTLTKNMSSVFGDYHFAEYGKQGCFHSYTYCYFRKRNSRSITLYGSKSERQGFTVFEADMNDGIFKIKKDIEGLALKAGDEYEVFNIAIIEDEFDAAFDKYFFDFVGVKEPKIKHLAGYTSWYNYFQKIDEHIILRDLDGMDRAKDVVGIFQVDDGYESAVGDWLIPDKKKFPNGMKYIADKIHDKGYMAGIWLAPFNAQRSAKIRKDHPDWFILDPKTGKQLFTCPGWGGAYVMDIYNPEVRDYIKRVFDTVLNDWGYDMVKLDFLYSQCMYPRNGKTRGEIMCDGVDFLREVCGDKLILGCGVPLGACMGVFDACRIGCDANKAFGGDILNRLAINNEIPSSQNAIINTIFRNHLDGRAFCNDPDVLFLRDNNIKYTLEQKLLLGKVNAVCGNVLFVSDNAGDYDSKQLHFMTEFFKDKDYKVLGAQFETDEIIKLDYVEDGVNKTLKFNVQTGKSNVIDCV
ncbi:MAG: alpha-galactosidase [Clostridia bacterium]|nr:alpha-galactosidase [Clostridia bacterium]